MRLNTMFFAVMALSAGCADPASDVSEHAEKEPGTILPGGSNPADAPPVPQAAVSDASAERPCGSKTLAVIHHASGVNVTFCNLADGVVAVGETAPLGTPSLMSRMSSQTSICPREVWKAIAPELAVPAAIDRDCEKVATRAFSRTNTASDTIDGVYETRSSDPVTAASACDANGPANFYNDHCLGVQNWSKNVSGGWNGTKFYYCIKDQLWGWHDRWSSAYIGEGDTGYERVAACNGAIRFRAWWRWDVGDSWIASLDTTVSSNSYYVWYIAEWNGGEDIDVRFRVDSAGGVHRHAGIFEDY